MLAGFGSGFDLKLTNINGAVHPRLQQQNKTLFTNNSDHIIPIINDCEFLQLELPRSSNSGSNYYGHHNTYHGPTRHIR